MAGTAERVGMGRGEREEDGQESDPFHGGSPLTACGTMTIRCGPQTARITVLAGAKMSRGRCAYCVGPDRKSTRRVSAGQAAGSSFFKVSHAAPCTARHGVGSQAEPVACIMECSRPVRKNVARQPLTAMQPNFRRNA